MSLPSTFLSVYLMLRLITLFTENISAFNGS